MASARGPGPSCSIVGPITDPAGAAGLADLVTAFQRIAAVNAPFIVNNSEGLQYLSQTIALDAGLAPVGGLFVNERLKEGAAMQAAAARGGYTAWGLTPFLKYVKDNPLPLRPLVLADPILQPIMVTTVVDPAKAPMRSCSARAPRLTGIRCRQAYVAAYVRRGPRFRVRPRSGPASCSSTAGVLAGKSAQLALLGITDPGTWSAVDWVSDVVPHIACRAVTAAAYAGGER